MMIDAFAPEGFTELTVDSIFMMPQLGVLSTVNEAAALEVFRKDCLIRLGWCLAPRAASGAPPLPSRRGNSGVPCMVAQIRLPGQVIREELHVGQMRRVPLEPGQRATVLATPGRKFDLGAGRGKPVEREITGGEVGLILDARPRPLMLPDHPAWRAELLTQWSRALDVYPT
jgi:hypothetical protein